MNSRKILSFVVVAIMSLGALTIANRATIASASSTTDWIIYTPDNLPTDEGWSIIGSGEQTISNETLIFKKPINVAHYVIKEVLELNNSVGSTLEARVRVITGGWTDGYEYEFPYGAYLDIIDGTKIAQLMIGDGIIWLGLSGSDEPGESINMDTTNDFHTYRLTLKGNTVRVYVDGNIVINRTAWVGNVKYIKWGVATSSWTTDGESHWNYLKYRTDGAFAPIINAIVTIKPEKLNNADNGKLTIFVQIPNYNVADVNESSITLLNATCSYITVIKDIESNKLIIKYLRSEAYQTGGWYTLEGYMKDNTKFKGADYQPNPDSGDD